MSRLVRVLVGLGLVLGGLGALGWHRQPGPFARAWPPAWVVVPPGGPGYSGFIAADAVSDWSKLWWPAVMVLPLFGAAIGALLGVLVLRCCRERGGLVAIAVLGLLVGVGSALAWHVDPGQGIGWVGNLEEEIDIGYPLAGLALGLIAALIAGFTGGTNPSSENTTPPTR